MKRLFGGLLVVLASVTVLVGCGGSEPSTTEETRTEQQIEQENADYEAEMDAPDEGE
ncbi:hypothetical protein Mal15_34820 [Stieleria maiorica]|uniref:Secreted protein n=1 Tax=Stieleria maiorica TaxID=2795974 RepID=A0A5B9ME91_9BACT|nr:hypothetical protein [Stieleria maiorica]QEF99418.1 hypothetical protein Mal15_34820 [Stieleria maiorica]